MKQLFFALLGAVGVTYCAAQDLTELSEIDPLWLQHHQLEAWEASIDHDGDGLSALEEYHFGTDPINVTSHPNFSIGLCCDEDAQRWFHLEWDGRSGVTYQLFGTTDLQEWQAWDAPISLLGDQSVTLGLAREDAPKGHAFFRVSGEAGDSDGDGLTDLVEIDVLGTDPNNMDTDGDQLTDGHEVRVSFTDPLVPNGSGGTASGRVWRDDNEDGLANGESSLEGIEVYLDLNLDGEWTPGEPLRSTIVDGSYEFAQLQPGFFHVRQRLTPGVTQTHPRPQYENAPDGLPNEVLAYDHGVGGPLEVPYGRMADTWRGPKKVLFPAPVQAVDTNLLLCPINERGVVPRLGVWSSSEFVSLPENAEVTLRFDERIVDGDGIDLVIHATNSPAGEQIQVFAGTSEVDLVDLGIYRESDVAIGIDLADKGIKRPIQVVKVRSLNSEGVFPGFDMVGVEALHYVPAAPLAHEFEIIGKEHVSNLDFGRVFRDLPPTVVLTLHNDYGTYAVGQPFIAQVTASDDLGSVTSHLLVNGQTQSLDSEGKAIITPVRDQTLTMIASAEDSSGQARERSLTVIVGEGDPTSTDDPFVDAADGAPTLTLITPQPGTVWQEEVAVEAVLGNVVGDPTWALSYASIDLVDPKAVGAEDADYIILAEGSGIPVSNLFGNVPVTTLEPGIYFLRLSASNSGGATRHLGWAIGVGIEESSIRPEVVIDSPAFDDQVNLLAQIEGSIRSARTLEKWTVEYALAADVELDQLNAPGIAWQELATGQETVEDGVLGEFDATVLANDAYILRVSATNDIGIGQVEGVRVQVAGEAKLGRLRREFVDFDATVGGLSMAMRRVYDSVNLTEPGALGYGWSYAFSNPEIKETVPDTGSTPFNAAPFRDGTRVYLNAPDGRRLGFTFHPEPGDGSFLGQTYRATFEADPGVLAKLEVPQGDQSFLSVNENGETVLFLIGLAWNPDSYILEMEDGVRYHYDQDFGFVDATSPTGATVTRTSHGLAHSNGLRVGLDYDDAGRLRQVTDPDGLIWKYAYDDQGDLVMVKDPDGNLTRYAYENHRLISVTDPFGRTGTVFEYDDAGRLVATIDAEGNRTELGWDPGSFSGSTTDALGRKTQYVYDERGNVLRSEDPLGQVTIYTYEDPRHPDLETSITDAKGHTTQKRYDEAGRLIATTFPDGTTTEQAWDAAGRLLSEREDSGRERIYQYTEEGVLTFENEPDRPSQSHVVDGAGQVSVTRDGLGFETRYQYDTNGHLTHTADSNGVTLTQGRDAKGRVMSATTGAAKTTLARNAQGWPTEMIDAAGKQSRMDFDDVGALKHTNSEGESTDYHLNAEQELTQVVQADGQAYKFTYTKSGMISRFEYPDGSAWTFQYDALDQATHLTDRAGKTIQLGYDAVGNRNLMINRNGKKRTFEHDARNRLVAERWHGAGDEVIREIRYHYHNRGYLERVTDGDYEHLMQGGEHPRARQHTYRYPGQSPFRLVYEWETDGEDLSNPGLVRVVGGDTSRTHEIRAAYSGGVPQQFSCKYPDGSVARTEWRYSPEGLLVDERRYDKLAAREPISQSTYAHDALGQLAFFDHGTSLEQDEAIYERDGASRITSIITTAGATQYAYDLMGQLLSATPSNSGAKESYAYTALRNLSETSSTFGPNDELLGTEELAFSYDAEGNLIERRDKDTGTVTRYLYDHVNQLTKVTVHASASALAHKEVEFTYDYARKLIARTIDGDRTWILNDREMPIVEFRDGESTPSAAFYYALDRVDHFLGAWREGVGARWFLLDHVMSVRGILSHDGEPVAWRDYNAYGELLTSDDANEPIGYAGRFWSADCQLYENRLRMYDPVLGRFLQQDPMLFRSNEPNLYRYAVNNPLRWRDPMGTASALEFAYTTSKIVLNVENVHALVKLGDCLKGIFEAAAQGLDSDPETGGDAGGAGVECIRHLPGFPPFVL